MIAVAAPMPREEPVTRAEPSGRSGASDTDAHRPAPLDHGRAPADPGAEGAEQDAGALAQLAAALGLRQRQRDRRRRGVAELGDRVDDPLAGDPEPLAD